MAIKLYDLCGRNKSVRFSPYCWRAKMALKHKGLEFETIATPFTQIGAIGENFKSVPVLNDNGLIVRDSFDIALHLDVAYETAPALFGHEGVVAAARVIEGWTITSLHPIIMRMIVNDICNSLDEPDQVYFRQSREARLGKPLETAQEGVGALIETLANAMTPARRALEHHEYLGGAAPLFTDYIVLGALMWLRSIHGSVPFADDDLVGIWFNRCLALYDGYADKAEKAA